MALDAPEPRRTRLAALNCGASRHSSTEKKVVRAVVMRFIAVTSGMVWGENVSS